MSGKHGWMLSTVSLACSVIGLHKHLFISLFACCHFDLLHHRPAPSLTCSIIGLLRHWLSPSVAYSVLCFLRHWLAPSWLCTGLLIIVQGDREKIQSDSIMPLSHDCEPDTVVSSVNLTLWCLQPTLVILTPLCLK